MRSIPGKLPRRFSPSVVVGLLLFTSLTAAVAQTAEPQAADAEKPPPRQRATSNTPPSFGDRTAVFDIDALNHTQSYCLDVKHLRDIEAADFQNFLAKEGQPGKVLSLLPWKLRDDCAKADAVARVYFTSVESSKRREQDARRDAAMFGFPRGRRPVLLIYDRASIRLYYRAEGPDTRGDPLSALTKLFSGLLEDLQQMAP